MIAFLVRLLFRDGPPPKGAKWSLYAHHLGDYMHRWLLRTPWGTLRLHHILRSDDDRHLHDHPFDFRSFLLTAGYIEHTPGGWSTLGSSRATQSRLIPRLSVVTRKAEALHRLELWRPVWTVVWSGPKRREWGFATPKGWIPHQRYRDEYPEVVAARVGEANVETVVEQARRGAA